MRYFLLFMPALSIVVALAPMARNPRQSPIEKVGRAVYRRDQNRYAAYYQQRARYERLRYQRYAMAKRQAKNK